MNKLLLGIVGFIIAMVAIVIMLVSGGGDTKKPVNTGPTLMSLPNYAKTGATVSLTTEGRVVGDDTYREIRITIGASERVIQIVDGYNGRVIDSKIYSNNEEAYTVFLKSISNYGFLSRIKTKTPLPDDERGICPLGLKYVYELDQGNDHLSRLWSSSCGQKIGTFAGSSSTIQTLFKAQITDYSQFTAKTSL